MGETVQELREAHRQWSDGEEGCRDCGTNYPCVSQRAAYEIERLRASLLRAEMLLLEQSGATGREGRE